MKRNIIFIAILSGLLITIISTEIIYSYNFKKITSDTINQCQNGQKNDYIKCADKLYNIMKKRKVINRLFYSKDITHQVIAETKKLKVYADRNELGDAKVSIENIKYLFKSLYRFNEN